MTTKRSSIDHRYLIWTCKLTLCVATAATALGCGDGVEPAAGETSSSLTCASPYGAGGWVNQGFARQRAFRVELDVTPQANGVDAVIGLSDGPAATFSDLAAIVRLNPQGTFDARDGATYRATTALPYQAGRRYHLRLDVDVANHGYSVWLRDATGGYEPIAINFAFRTEQSAVVWLDHVASKIDGPDPDSTVQICGITITPAPVNGCVTALAGQGFVPIALPDATTVDSVAFDVTVNVDAPIDAVFGLSAGAPTRFSDLAAAVRFGTERKIEALDGDTYRQDAPATYDTGARGLRITADLASHTYAVYDRHSERELGHNIRFRTAQNAVGHLDHFSAIVDGDSGSVTVCNVYGEAASGVVYGRSGGHTVVPLPGGAALTSDGTEISRLDAAGRILVRAAYPGAVVGGDAAGNIYAATTFGTTVFLDKLDANLAFVSRATAPILDGATVEVVNVTPSGSVMVGLSTPARDVIAVRFTAAGPYDLEQFASGDVLAFDGESLITAWNVNQTVRISRHHPDGSYDWQASFAGDARLTALTVDPSGAVLFGGDLRTAMDFGGGVLPTRHNGAEVPANGFVVKLSRAGAHVFSRRTDYSWVGGIAANQSAIVVSSTERTQFEYLQLQVYDPSGAPLPAPSVVFGGPNHGTGRQITMSDAGRIWWFVDDGWRAFFTWPYLLAIDR